MNGQIVPHCSHGTDIRVFVLNASADFFTIDSRPPSLLAGC